MRLCCKRRKKAQGKTPFQSGTPQLMFEISGQVSLIKSSGISNTFMKQCGLVIELKRHLLLRRCWGFHVGLRLRHDCVSYAVMSSPWEIVSG